MSENEKRKFDTEIPLVTLRTGLAEPPLSMVLVHAENERRNAAAGPVRRRKKSETGNEETVMRIIEHLEKNQ
jgi:hypothetical protein